MFCALVNGEGEVTDFLRLPHFTKRRNAWREEEREKKVSPGVAVTEMNVGSSGQKPSSFSTLIFYFPFQAQDIETLKKFLLNKKPHVVTIAGENRSVLVFLPLPSLFAVLSLCLSTFHCFQDPALCSPLNPFGCLSLGMLRC